MGGGGSLLNNQYFNRLISFSIPVTHKFWGKNHLAEICFWIVRVFPSLSKWQKLVGWISRRDYTAVFFFVIVRTDYWNPYGNYPLLLGYYKVDPYVRYKWRDIGPLETAENLWVTVVITLLITGRGLLCSYSVFFQQHVRLHFGSSNFETWRWHADRG